MECSLLERPEFHDFDALLGRAEERECNLAYNAVKASSARKTSAGCHPNACAAVVGKCMVVIDAR